MECDYVDILFDIIHNFIVYSIPFCNAQNPLANRLANQIA